MILRVAQDHPTSGLIWTADHLINPHTTPYLKLTPSRFDSRGPEPERQKQGGAVFPVATSYPQII